MALAIDGGGTAASFLGLGTAITSGTLGVVTVNTNDVIVVAGLAAALNSSGTVTVSGGGLTWNSRAVSYQSGPGVWYFINYAIATAALATSTFTVSLGHTSSFITSFNRWATAFCFGVSGANTAAPFDANGPVFPTSANQASWTLTPATSNTLVYEFVQCATNAVSPLGHGWTLLNDQHAINNFDAYQVLTSSTAVLGNYGSGFANTAAGVIDAIVINPTTFGAGGSGVNAQFPFNDVCSPYGVVQRTT